MRRPAPTRLRRRLAGDDSGAAAVEFALVVPLLLLLVFGIINFGVLFSQQVSINNGVREGARRAVVGDPSAPRTCDGILASVRNQLSGLALNPDDVEIKVTQDWGSGSDSNGCGTAYVLGTFAGSATDVPCKGSYDSTTNTARSLIVEARLVSTIPVSFPPFPTTTTLNSKAVYRCEFSV